MKAAVPPDWKARGGFPSDCQYFAASLWAYLAILQVHLHSYRGSISHMKEMLDEFHQLFPGGRHGDDMGI